MDKKEEDSKRLKYTRAIERFVRSVIGYLVKEEESTFEGFVERVHKQLEFVEKVEPVTIYKEEFQVVENFVNELIHIANGTCDDFTKLRNDLLHKSNQLHKRKNQKKYKKDKHQKSKYREWE